ncbi:B-cell receptor CD22-like [Xenentodon cancila]
MRKSNPACRYQLGEGLMAGLFVKVVTLGVFFLSGVLADCDKTPSLFITAPKKIEAFSGSCLQISCNFIVEEGKEFNGSREIIGVWLKHDTNLNLDKNNVVFNSSKQNNIYPINITGNMKVKNCTTLFYILQTKHSDTYYFRIENGPFRATASCDDVIITVKDSPWRPTINIPDDLKENERVTVTCSAVTPCPHSPPELTWNLQQDFHTQTEKNNDGTFTTKIQKNITLSDTHDGYNIRCSVRYPVNEGKHFKTSQTEKTLSVSYAPKDTSASISPSGLMSAGSWVKLTCSSRANPPVSTFTWFKKSEDGDMKVAEGDFYILNVTVGGVYYCVATNDVGKQTSADISLNVWKILRYVIFIIFLVGSVWWLKSTRSTSNQTQNVVLHEPNGIAESQDIHYGEVNFARLGPPLGSVQHSSEEQNVVYAQVKPRRTEKSPTQTGDDIYAQVRKK